jgi:hypothetical protein
MKVGRPKQVKIEIKFNTLERNFLEFYPRSSITFSSVKFAVAKIRKFLLLVNSPQSINGSIKSNILALQT